MACIPMQYKDSNGHVKNVCVPVPMLVRDADWMRLHPDWWKPYPPEPWVTVLGLSEELTRNLVVLATINQLIKTLPGDQQTVFQDGFKKAATEQQRQLGVQVNF